jgi:hypothetical protein
MAKASGQDAFNEGMRRQFGGSDPSGHFNPIGAVIQIGAGAAGTFAGGYRGLWDLATGGFSDEAQKKAVKDIHSTQRAFNPGVNDATMQAVTSPKNPLNWPGLIAEKAGDATNDATGSPLLATGVTAGLNALPAIAGLPSVSKALVGAGAASDAAKAA